MEWTSAEQGFHNSWDAFLKEQEAVIREIMRRLTGLGDYTPDDVNIFRFMCNDLKSAKVVIVGQDPYPEAGKATGRAFEVSGLTNWLEPFRQGSLKNIVRLLHETYRSDRSKDGETGRSFSKDVEPGTPINKGEAPGYPISFEEIRSEIREGEFIIKSPPTLFQSWEDQGVILLNRYLTCQNGKPGSHRDLWKPLTEELIRYMHRINPALRWFLWGSDAKTIAPMLQDDSRTAVYMSRHPMLCAERYADDFLKGNCFRETKDEVFWL